LEYSDFAVDKFKNDSSDDEKEYFKIILRAIRSQNEILKNNIEVNNKRMEEMDLLTIKLISDQKLFTDYINTENNKMNATIATKSNDIGNLQTSTLALIHSINSIQSKISN